MAIVIGSPILFSIFQLFRSVRRVHAFARTINSTPASTCMAFRIFAICQFGCDRNGANQGNIIKYQFDLWPYEFTEMAKPLYAASVCECVCGVQGVNEV